MFTVYFGVDNLIYRSFMEYIIKIHRWSEKSEEFISSRKSNSI